MSDAATYFFACTPVLILILLFSPAILKAQDKIPVSKNADQSSRAAFLSADGGHISYATSYRSIIDTPYSERNILQHHLTGRFNFMAAGTLPLQATYLIRHSNSSFFRNIYDVQLSLDPAGMRRLLAEKLRRRLLDKAASWKDSLVEKNLKSKANELKGLQDWLKSPLQKQRLIEAREMLTIPAITHRIDLSDEQNRLREDSLKKHASRFIALYEQADSTRNRLITQVDSLRKIHEQIQQKIAFVQQLSSADVSNYSAYVDWKQKLKEYGIEESDLPKGYKHLLAVRNFSLGRSPLNYSELTAKNISINGINLEYNSWYYAALSAGLVDFRFRDFAIGSNRNKQYLLMARAGVGRLDHNFAIVSVFKGRKQLFASSVSNPGLTAIDITGYSLQTKWTVYPNTYVTAEVAQSISPDFRSGDLTTKTNFNFKDQSNKGFALGFSGYYPATKLRVEAGYKYTGANYQSFSSFQTNASMRSWHVKADQYLINNMFKFSGSLRSNDFFNPYVIQNYKSNTIFKSASVTFRKKKWPVLSAGYQPFSQYSKIGDQLAENRFQSLTANIYHYYRVGNTRTASTVMFNRFFNSGSDTGFVFYNANNFYIAQNIFISENVIANLAVSDTRNDQYRSQVFDESLQFAVNQYSTVVAGVKINNFNKQAIKVGGYASASVRIWKGDILYLSYERAFLPGFNNRLLKNDMASVQFTKIFAFKQHK